MHDLRAIAHALGGEARGKFVYAPAPGHSPRDRSMWLRLDSQAPDGWLVGGFAGEGWQELKDYVRSRLGLERATTAIRYEHTRPRADASNDNRQRALEIAKASQPLAGSIAETYLVKRIGRTIEWPACLRFHPACPRGGERLPSLIAILRDAVRNEFRCIQRVFLKPDGSDRLRDPAGKMTLGSAAGAVCKLSPDESVTAGMGICEGVEKSLAVMGMGWAPIWATCGASNLSNFPVLQGIEALTIFADGDEAGQKAAQACGRRWAAAGREVVIRTPRVSGDFSDALKVRP